MGNHGDGKTNMKVTRCCFSPVAIFAAACLLSAQAVAQQSGAAASSYERGVEAYVAGDNAAAETLLAEAIREVPHDPRSYYFRALCQLRQGRRIEARAEMLIGATLEARAQGAYPIDQSLAQVPLAERLLLDEFHWRAGVVTAVTEPEGDGSGLAGPVATDAAVLRQKVAVRLDQLVQPISLADLVQHSAIQPPIAQTQITQTQINQTPLADPTVKPAVNAEELSAGNPFADDAPSAPAGKIPSGKLIGILGRALLKSTPVESFDNLREKLPALPLPGAAGDSPAAAPGADAEATAAPAGEDPFAEPSPPPTEERNDKPETDATEEDPFG